MTPKARNQLKDGTPRWDFKSKHILNTLGIKREEESFEIRLKANGNIHWEDIGAPGTLDLSSAARVLFEKVDWANNESIFSVGVTFPEIFDMIVGTTGIYNMYKSIFNSASIVTR